MKFGERTTIGERLVSWQTFQGIGKRKQTLKYHREILKTIRTNWANLESVAIEVTFERVLEFIQKVAHFSAPRFNAMVSVLKSICPAASDLKRRKVQPKHVTLPGQGEFMELLRELDAAPRSHGGLMVRFLALTGLRIKEAGLIEWADITDDGIVVRAEISKNGKGRFIPSIGELQSVLNRLRSVTVSEFVLPQAECKRSLATACRKVGIKRLTHHDMRRLFATRSIESGVDLPTAARWMGHSDGGALLGRTYFHLQDQHSRDMAEKVDITV